VTHEESVYRGRILELVIQDDHWEIVRHADAVAVLAQDAQGRVLGVSQWRPAVGVRTWELPAGLIDAGETPLAAAARELAEEAQLGGTLTPITAGFVSPGFTTEKVHLFHAQDLHPCSATPDSDEALEIRWMDAESAWQAIAKGELHASVITLVGLSLMRQSAAKSA
jgi:ADP-ribose pyrophosphatase